MNVLAIRAVMTASTSGAAMPAITPANGVAAAPIVHRAPPFIAKVRFADPTDLADKRESMSTMSNTDPFDARLRIVDRMGRTEEGRAALLVYERLLTARAITDSLLPGATPADVVAVLAVLSPLTDACVAAELARMSSASGT
jgi:hypothetical protein